MAPNILLKGAIRYGVQLQKEKNGKIWEVRSFLV